MSEPKFTKGPWTFCNDDKGMYQATDDGKRIKLLFSFDMSFVGISSSEHKANVALIAAAPEMYALLLDIVTDYQCMPNPAVMADKIEAVLKKARGRQK